MAADPGQGAWCWSGRRYWRVRGQGGVSGGRKRREPDWSRGGGCRQGLPEGSRLSLRCARLCVQQGGLAPQAAPSIHGGEADPVRRPRVPGYHQRGGSLPGGGHRHQVSFAALAARGERLQHLHSLVFAGGALCFHGLTGSGSCCTTKSPLQDASVLCTPSFVHDDFKRYKVDLAHVAEHPAYALPISMVISNTTAGTRTILHAARFILSDFQRRNVNVAHVVWQSLGETPCACCIVNCSSGSRTITVYDTNMPDVTDADFEQVNLSQYKWIHWEGRNASEQVKMMRRVEEYNQTRSESERVATSVEVEKPRQELYQLFGYGDVVFVSKDVAKDFGFHSASEAVKGLYRRVKPGATLICAWAEYGADAMGPDEQLVHSDAFPPDNVVDTLGAGDTFNASVILALSRGRPLHEAITYGCQVAGRKCGVHGYDGIV